MFGSNSEKKWQPPQSSPAIEPDKLTQYPCPVCQKPMAEHHYKKAGQAKKMLRCSDAEARGDRKHKDAVYFFTKGQWWSPKFGVLEC